VLLHDDFLHVPTLSVGVGATSAAACDSPWMYTAPAGSARTATLAQAGLGAGTAALSVTNTSGVGQLLKDTKSVALPSGGAIHCTAMIALNPIPLGVGFAEIVVGLADSPGGITPNHAYVFLSGSNSSGAQAGLGVGDGVVLVDTYFLATVPQANVFYIIDLIVSSSFVVAWVGTDGPYTVRANIPVAAMNPMCYVESKNYTGTLTAYLDYYELAQVPVVDPALVGGG
jgi:hypothetical protein